MTEILEQLRSLAEHDTAQAILRAIGILLAAWLVARVIARRVAAQSLRAQHRALLGRILGGVVYGVAVAWALSELGLNLGVVLGAAGVLTVAIGFAAQTAVSNLISGLFLMVERPFEIEDYIKLGSTIGEVVAIDLMSTKLRTLDNLYVRIPNETLLKAEVINYSHYPIRRHDIKLGVAYHTDLDHAREVLLGAARRTPLCLDEPEPLILFLGFGESALDIQFSVWATRESFIEMRNQIHESVRSAFAEAGIEIPFPHRTLYAGSQTEPLPIRLVEP
jgi:small-conductance mechanosensitive channel